MFKNVHNENSGFRRRAYQLRSQIEKCEFDRERYDEDKAKWEQGYIAVLEESKILETHVCVCYISADTYNQNMETQKKIYGMEGKLKQQRNLYSIFYLWSNDIFNMI